MSTDASNGNWVFVSYCREDRAAVEILVAELQDAGIDVKWDGAFPTGVDFQSLERDLIEKAGKFILVWSSRVAARSSTEVHREINLAIERLIRMPHDATFFLTLRLDESTPPDRPVDATRTLKSFGWSDLFPEDVRSATIDKLIREVKSAAGDDGSSQGGGATDGSTGRRERDEFILSRSQILLALHQQNFDHGTVGLFQPRRFVETENAEPFVGEDPWRVGDFVTAVRARSPSGADSKTPPRLILMLGEPGVGKSLLAMRLAVDTNASADWPAKRLFVDAHAAYARKTPDGAARRSLSDELVEALKRRLAERPHTPALVVIDGLDRVARTECTKLNNDVGAYSGGDWTAPKWFEDMLEAILVNFTAAEVVSFVVLVDAFHEYPGWNEAFQELADEHAGGFTHVTLAGLPQPTTSANYRRFYPSYLNIFDRSAGTKTIEQHPFLTTPFYLDAVRRNDVRLDGTRLSRLDIIALDAESEKPDENVVHPHALAETGRELLYFVECLTSSPAAAMQDQRFRELLTREWTSSWLELLTEHMQLNPAVTDAIMRLKRYLDERLAGNAKTRWKLAATFAMSNLITALVEAKQLLNFNSSIQFCNLQRTTFQDVVFDGGRLQAVDCTGAIFDGAQFKSGDFVAVDCTEATFNNCKFDGGSFHSICCKEAKFGGVKLGASATFANSDFTNAVWPEAAVKGQFAANSVNCLGLTEVANQSAPAASPPPPPLPAAAPVPPAGPNSSGGG